MATTYSNLKVGSTGTAVTALQQQLASQGYYKGAIDGSYGNITAAAVTAYQKANGLTVDGLAGNQTQSTLYSSKAANTPVYDDSGANTVSSKATNTNTNVAAPVKSMTGNAFGGVSSAIPATPAKGNILTNIVGKVSDVIAGLPAAAQAANNAIQSTTTQQVVDAANAALMKASATAAAAKAARPQTKDTNPTPSTSSQSALTGNVPGTNLSTGQGTSPREVAIANNTNPEKFATGSNGNIVGSNSQTQIGGYSSSGGGGGSGGSGGTAAASSTLVPGATATSDNPYFSAVQEMKFDWNSATDPAYIQEASNLENTVTQQMVGRGMLYSSVYSSHLQASLTQLQVDMRQQRYTEFTAERTFLMQEASFYADRQDAAFTKQMQILNYNMQVEEMKFNQSMQRAQLAASQASANAARETANAAKQTAALRANTQTAYATYYASKDQYDTLLAKWSSSGKASQAVADYFGVPVGSSMAWAGSKISAASSKVETLKSSATALALQRDQADLVMDSISTLSSTSSAADQNALAMDNNYSATSSELLGYINSLETAQDAYNETLSNKTYIISQIGNSNYIKLLADAKSFVTQYQYADSWGG